MWQRENNAAASETSVKHMTSVFAYQPVWPLSFWLAGRGFSVWFKWHKYLWQRWFCCPLRLTHTRRLVWGCHGGTWLKSSDLQLVLLLKCSVQNWKIWGRAALAAFPPFCTWGIGNVCTQVQNALMVLESAFSHPSSGEPLANLSLLSCFSKLVNRSKKVIFEQPTTSEHKCCSLV